MLVNLGLAALSDEQYPLFIAHSTSAYPCKPEELNLKMIQTLAQPNTGTGVPAQYDGTKPGWLPLP